MGLNSVLSFLLLQISKLNFKIMFKNANIKTYNISPLSVFLPSPLCLYSLGEQC